MGAAHTKHPEASVIVTTYNRRRVLEACLAALSVQDSNNFEIVVADDGSNDDSFKIVEASPSVRKVRYVWHPHDGWGLSRTRNDGARQARGDMLIFLDADILLNRHAITAYTELYHANPNRAIGGYYKYLPGMEYTVEDVREWDAMWEMRLPRVEVPQRKVPIGMDVRDAHFEMGLQGESVFLDENKVYPTPLTLIGGNMMIPRHIWERTEGFDESLTQYGGEDAEMSFAIADLGYGFSYSRRAAGMHVAHPKRDDAEVGTDAAIKHIMRKYPRWYLPDGNPIWTQPNWVHPAKDAELHGL